MGFRAAYIVIYVLSVEKFTKKKKKKIIPNAVCRKKRKKSFTYLSYRLKIVDSVVSYP